MVAKFSSGSTSNVANVLFIVPRFHTNMRGWLEALVSSGASVRVLTVTTGLTEDHSLAKPIPLVATKRAKLKTLRGLEKERETSPEQIAVDFFWPDLRKLWRQVSDFPFDTAVVRAPLRWGFPVLIILRFCSLRAHLRLYHQRPLVRTSRGKSLKSLIKEWGFRGLLTLVGARPASPVLARHSLTAEEFQSAQDHHQNVFMPFLLNTEQPITSRPQQKTLRILSIGKFREYKNHDVLVEALGHLDDKVRKSIELRIVGQAKLEIELRYLHALREKLSFVDGLGDLVIQTNVDSSEMANYYDWASCTLLTSIYERAAISPLEGMAYGAFPISTSENGTNCYFEDGKSGFLFEAGNSKSLADRLLWLVTNTATRESLRLASIAELHKRARKEQFFYSLGLNRL